MKRKTRKSNLITLATGMLFYGVSAFGASTTTQVPVEQQILQISASGSIQTIYNSATGSDSRITILGYLPSIINRFNVNPTLSTRAHSRFVAILFEKDVDGAFFL
jgi:hypothetical protein